MIAGTQGYAEQARELLARYEEIRFEAKHPAFLPLLPAHATNVLDVGAGTGADSAWFAEQGHRVVAVEPTAELRVPGMAMHPSPAIAWVDDGLPHLAQVATPAEGFGVILLSAVWMHLDEAQRAVAMPRVAALLAGDGVLLMTLRHGPVPEGRRMFDVSGNETIALARAQGLRAVLEAEADSVLAFNRAAGVRWTVLAFRHATANA